MSKYFQVLERLERGSGGTATSRALDALVPRDGADRAAPRAAARPARPAAKPVVDPGAKAELGENALGAAPATAPIPAPTAIVAIRSRPSPRVEPLRFPPSTSLAKGVDAVFHNIEALTMGRRPMALVFAGASASESVQALTSSLTDYAEGKGERVLVAELRESGGDRMLVCRHPPEAATPSEDGDHSTLQIDLHGGANRETLARWREQVGPGADIMFLIGPPLVDSVDSALLASLCDGLIVVAVQEETHRASLTVASERARLTKTPTLAVVVNKGRDKTPSWLRRVLE